MHMVRHQAIPYDLHPALTAVLGQQFDVPVAVGIKQENVLAVITSLGDVMRRTHRHHPRLTGHRRKNMIISQFSAAYQRAPSPPVPFPPLSPVSLLESIPGPRWLQKVPIRGVWRGFREPTVCFP